MRSLSSSDTRYELSSRRAGSPQFLSSHVIVRACTTYINDEAPLGQDLRCNPFVKSKRAFSTKHDSLKPFFDKLIHFARCLRQGPVTARNFSPTQLGDEFFHANGHFRLENIVFCPCDEEDRLAHSLAFQPATISLMEHNWSPGTTYICSSLKLASRVRYQFTGVVVRHVALHVLVGREILTRTMHAIARIFGSVVTKFLFSSRISTTGHEPDRKYSPLGSLMVALQYYQSHQSRHLFGG